MSNPYLSQIERGLRKPSAEVLQQIAKALRISAEQLYIRAGIVSPEDGVGGSVELAVLADSGLTERQKQSLLDVYASFLAQNTPEHENETPNLTPTPKELNMADTKFDIKTEATRPFYATVGVTDLAVEVARQYVTDVQAKVADVQKKIEKLDFEPKSQQARLEAKLADLQAEAQEGPGPLRGAGRRDPG